MNPGITLTTLADELERQVAAKKDYIVNTEDGLAMAVAPVSFAIPGVGTFEPTDLAHNQVAQHVGIPKPYYDRMRTEAPDLLAANVNRWLRAKPERRMVRTLDHNARAFLSDRYRPLDNYDLALAALPALKEARVKVISSGLTDTRLYFKGIVEDLAIGLSTLGWAGAGGDAIIPAIEFSNSEVGAGALTIHAGYYLTSCTNLSMWKDLGLLRKYHIGRAFDTDGEVANFYTEETRIADDRAFWLKVRDAIAGAISQDVFKMRVKTLEEAKARSIENIEALPAVVQVTLDRFSLPGDVGKPVLRALIEGNDFTAFGLSNAVTRVAGTFDHARYDLSTRMEHVGGAIIDLDPTEWRVIARATDADVKVKRKREAVPA